MHLIRCYTTKSGQLKGKTAYCVVDGLAGENAKQLAQRIGNDLNLPNVSPVWSWHGTEMYFVASPNPIG
jgi:hypothetical protein